MAPSLLLLVVLTAWVNVVLSSPFGVKINEQSHAGTCSKTIQSLRPWYFQSNGLSIVRQLPGDPDTERVVGNGSYPQVNAMMPDGRRMVVLTSVWKLKPELCVVEMDHPLKPVSSCTITATWPLGGPYGIEAAIPTSDPNNLLLVIAVSGTSPSGYSSIKYSVYRVNIDTCVVSDQLNTFSIDTGMGSYRFVSSSIDVYRQIFYPVITYGASSVVMKVGYASTNNATSSKFVNVKPWFSAIAPSTDRSGCLYIVISTTLYKVTTDGTTVQISNSECLDFVNGNSATMMFDEKVGVVAFYNQYSDSNRNVAGRMCYIRVRVSPATNTAIDKATEKGKGLVSSELLCQLDGMPAFGPKVGFYSGTAASFCLNDCSLHGTCPDGDDKCECERGYNGSTCAVCDSTILCHDRGKCSITGPCLCQYGWEGDHCETCDATRLCNGHGTCSNDDGSCMCDAGFFGDACSQCNSSYFCSGHGICSLERSVLNPICQCHTGFSGDACDKCDVSVCNSHGVCEFNTHTNTSSCVCASGWSGDTCTTCDSATLCSGHGVCSDDHDGACACDDGYAGASCDMPCSHSPIDDGHGCSNCSSSVGCQFCLDSGEFGCLPRSDASCSSYIRDPEYCPACHTRLSCSTCVTDGDSHLACTWCLDTNTCFNEEAGKSHEAKEVARETVTGSQCDNVIGTNQTQNCPRD